MRFGQYELLELIAVGGMAEVYRGRVAGVEGFEKHVAIKRILPDLAQDERFVTMLLTEARIHSALSHRNIVQIHDLGISQDGEYFIVFEYVEGHTLRRITEVLGGEIIPEALSLYIASEVAQALHFAHDMRGSDGQPLGIVHRDVTPSNILISLAGEVKLSDFGLAKRRTDRSVVGSLKGNLAYMSPEQARQARLDRRTDVFALGAVLFELLTGRRLREITDEVKAWTEVASGVVASPRSVRPDLPDSFERLLSRALAADPAARFPDAGAFGAAIRELLGEMNAPVGASDLQALVSAVEPRKNLRSVVEASKVIRLVPDGRPGQPPDEQASRRTPPAPLVSPPPPPRSPPPRPSGRMQIATPSPPVQVALPPAAGPSAPAVAGSPRRVTPNAPSPARPATPPAAQAWRQQATPQPPRTRRYQTAKTHAVKLGGFWRPVLVVIAATLILGAGAVHLAIMPLDVLATWGRPVSLFVSSEPSGAAVRLDGKELAERTPAQIQVARDRFDHLVEVTHPGYRATREIIRYDRTAALSFTLTLQRDTGAATNVVPPPPLPAAVADAGTGADGQVAADGGAREAGSFEGGPVAP